MKKMYIKPEVCFEETENDIDLMTGSNPTGGVDTLYGGIDGYGNKGGNGVQGTGDDDDFFQGAKGMGNFAFAGDFEYSL